MKYKRLNASLISCILLEFAMLLLINPVQAKESNIFSQTIQSFENVTKLNPEPEELRLTKVYESGREIYNYRCYYCHGYSGDAKTLATRFVSPKPMDFTAKQNAGLAAERMLTSIHGGRPGTAMPAFGNTLSKREISDVIYFIQQGFMSGGEADNGYHTSANGWQNHAGKYASAYPYVLGEISIDTLETTLSASQKEGRKLFFDGCITCHELFTENESEIIFEPRAVSYPRSHNPFQEPDFISQASVFSKHEKQDEYLAQSDSVGNQLYQENCAFCHSPDRSGKNWIGNFLQPHPRDLADINYLQTQTVASLAQKIASGVPNSSMPRWDTVLSRQQIGQIARYLLLPITKEGAVPVEEKDGAVINHGQD